MYILVCVLLYGVDDGLGEVGALEVAVGRLALHEQVLLRLAGRRASQAAHSAHPLILLGLEAQQALLQTLGGVRHHKRKLIAVHGLESFVLNLGN